MTEDADADVMEIEPVSHPLNSKPPKTKTSAKPIDTKSLMWIEKYRPKDLSELLSHHQIVNTLSTLISNNRLPHLLFCGPPGTGKTSTILACAKQMYGQAYKSMILELNASDDRGISVVRDQIKSFASTRRLFSSGIKLIVLDEADAMTSSAQMALRCIVEKYAANTRFCIICNYVNRIIPALQSRCTKFRFAPLPPQHVRKRVSEVADLEGVKLKPSGMDALLKLGKGDMRRILNILQSTHMASTAMGSGVIDVDAVYANTGSPCPGDIGAIWSWLMNDDYNTCCEKLLKLKAEKGLALDDIIAELVPFVSTAVGGSEKLNVAALVGSCKLASASAIDVMAS